MLNLALLRTAGLLCVAILVGTAPAAAQQNLELRSAEGAALTYSAPLDLGTTESWKRSGGQVRADRLLRLEGTLENRGRAPARVTIFAVRALGGSQRIGETEKNLAPGGADSPVLFETTLAPQQRLDLSRVKLQNQQQVGRMIGIGPSTSPMRQRSSSPAPKPIRIGVLATSEGGSGARRAPTHVALTAFDVPLNPEAFAGQVFVQGDRWIIGPAVVNDPRLGSTHDWGQVLNRA